MIGTSNMDEAFPRFQYSIFDKNGHDAQWVVRGNDWENFLIDVTAVQAKVDEGMERHDPIMAVTKGTITHPCKQCAADGIVSDTNFKEGVKEVTGKPWAGYFCTRVKAHVTWVPVASKA